MHIHCRTISTGFLCLSLAAICTSCKKLVAIPGPKNTITTTQVFSTEAQAEGAVAGIYTRMINGEDGNAGFNTAEKYWSAGAVRLYGGLSADELYSTVGPILPSYYLLSTNKLDILNTNITYELWKSAYSSIYGANSVIEGIAASESAVFRDSARKVLTAEAKFIRALAYFYLTNLYGDVPLALTVDFNQTAYLPRSAQQKVYDQIIADLTDARNALPSDFSTGKGERIRASKWAAIALLARTFLYTGQYENAAALATEVIDQHALFALEPDLNDVFLANSREAIFQLQQDLRNNPRRNATPEGYLSIAKPPYTGGTGFGLTDQLLHAFEPGDQRRTDWVDSTMNASYPGPVFYPVKYKVGADNGVPGAATEYYMVLRLAEMYLIRAEARAHGASGGPSEAIKDLNAIRSRTSLPDLAATLTPEEVIAAVEQERQIELFAEWGHRWLDLKRTGRASDVLSTIPLKQPWEGDYQLLYPIPVSEIRNNNALIQNPGYQ